MNKRNSIFAVLSCILALVLGSLFSSCGKTSISSSETASAMPLREGQELIASGLKVRIVKVSAKNYEYVVGDEPPEYGFALLTSKGEAFAVIPPLHDTVIQVDYFRREVRAGDRTFKIPEGETVAIAEGLAPAKKSTNP